MEGSKLAAVLITIVLSFIVVIADTHTFDRFVRILGLFGQFLQEF